MSNVTKKIVNHSIDYLFQHLNEPLTVKKVAGHFHYSEFYFSRIFKEETGESLYAFLKRLKMDQSAIDMKLKADRSITDIGLDYGYTTSNYSSAFKKHPPPFHPLNFVRRSTQTACKTLSLLSG